MGGIRAGQAIATVGFCLGLFVAGCGGAKNAQDKNTATTTQSSEEGERPRRPGKVACRLHSCSPPYFCNEESGVCEMLSCQTKKDCPYDYKCDFSRNVCR